MTDDSLPAGWCTTRLGDVVSYGVTVKAEPADILDDFWVLELEDIERDTSRILQRVTYADRKSKSTKNRFTKGDVLYGKLRPYLNKVVVADSDGVCTTEIVPLSVGALLDNRYLFWWLKHPRFLAYVTQVGYGVNMPRLGTADGIAAPFVLAPLAEQKQIAAKLDELLAQVDTLKARLDAIPAILKRFRQSVLAAAVSGRLTEDWRRSVNQTSVRECFRFGAVLTELRNGLSPKPAEQPPGSPILRISAIRPMKVDAVDVRFLDADESTVARYRLRRGDLLITRYNGTLDLVGVCGMYRGAEHATLLYPDKLIRARIDESIALPAYVEIWFGAPERRADIEGFVKSSAGQKGISGSDIKSLAIELPSVPEQAEIVRRVDQLFAFADQLEQRVKAAQARVNHLTQAILAKAFRGELTAEWRAQNPDLISGENSAEALLARIRAERAAAAKPRGGRYKTAVLDGLPMVAEEKAAYQARTKRKASPRV